MIGNSMVNFESMLMLHRKILRTFDPRLAVVLAFLIESHNLAKQSKRFNGWFPKTRKQICNELHLSKKQVSAIVLDFENIEFIETKFDLISKNDPRRVTFFKLDEDRINKFLQEDEIVEQEGEEDDE